MGQRRRKDRKQFEDVAHSAGMDDDQTREFGYFLHEQKMRFAEGVGPHDHFSYAELRRLADEFLQQNGDPEQ
jgi:hypothetical protein